MNIGVNQNKVERVIRVLGGALLALGGLVLVRGWLGVVMALAGAVLIVSGWIGFCHVKSVLRIDASGRRCK